MVEVYYIVTRKAGEGLYWSAPYTEVDFYPDEPSLQEAMYSIMEDAGYVVDRNLSAYSQWDEAEEFFPRDYHWGCQKIMTKAA